MKRCNCDLRPTDTRGNAEAEAMFQGRLGATPAAPPPMRSSPPVAFPPVRPNVGACGSAFRADHAEPERGHRHVARKMVDVHDHLVPALVTLQGERPRAMVAMPRMARLTRCRGGALMLPAAGRLTTDVFWLLTTNCQRRGAVRTTPPSRHSDPTALPLLVLRCLVPRRTLSASQWIAAPTWTRGSSSPHASCGTSPRTACGGRCLRRSCTWQRQGPSTRRFP